MKNQPSLAPIAFPHLALTGAVFLLMAAWLSAAAAAEKVTFNVRDFGAVGDGKTLDSPAVALKLCRGVLLRDFTIFHGGHFAIMVTGCDGWLRLLRFVPARRQIEIRTYSPSLEKFETDENSEFVAPWEMSAAYWGGR